MIALLSWAAVLASALVACRRATAVLHMWQMDSYINSRYLRWLFAKPFVRYIDLMSVGAAFATTLSPSWYGLGAWLAYNCWLLVRKEHTEAKKPLEYTTRARRTLWLARALLIATAAAVLILPPILLGLVLLHAAPWAVLGASLLLRPVQAHINRGFVRSARARLAERKPVVIGVAGSYGKTSTKYFLDGLLSERYNALKSPGNYNTLLGITKVINEMLQPEHEVLIAEMGAYKRGEVQEIAELVHPRIGIIVSIGPEHFERFLSMENIEQTNYELIAALPPDGLAVFNGDNESCRKLAAATRHTRVATYSVGNADGAADIWAEDVTLDREGLRFSIVTLGGDRTEVTTAIAGRHMVLNILGAARIALEMGVTLDQIRAGIAKLRPAPHRLEIKPGGGGTTIIDDSYNSNPIGAAEALHVLSQFRGGRRILVTPGMIELGVLHEEKNQEFGVQAAQSCDYVILVGPDQTRPIQEGLRRAGFPEDNLRIIKDLGETKEIFAKLLRPGDVILFENDLPDLYTEK